MSKSAPKSRVRSQTALKRLRPPRKAIAAAVSRFETGITAVLEQELAALTDRTRHLDNVSAPIRKLLAADPRTLASGKALYRMVTIYLTHRP